MDGKPPEEQAEIWINKIEKADDLFDPPEDDETPGEKTKEEEQVTVSEEPSEVVKEPLETIEEPAEVIEEPTVVVEEPPEVTKEPSVMIEEPPVVIEELPLVIEEPPVVTEEPPEVIEEPPEVIEEPPKVIEESPVIIEEPPVVIEEVEIEEPPEVIEKPPEVISNEPDSTTVEHLQPPKPPSLQKQKPKSLETSVIMDQNDLDKIISETLEIVDDGQKRANEQKLTIQKMAFILKKILENLEDYEKFVESLETFLVNNEALQSEWYSNYCQYLPSYGDYTEALEDSQEKITVDDLPFPVSEASLKNMTTDVVNNLYAGGTHVKTQHTLCKGIKEAMGKRRKFLTNLMEPFSDWFKLMNITMENQNTIRDVLFKVSAHVNFLKTGETIDPLTLNTTKSLKDLDENS